MNSSPGPTSRPAQQHIRAAAASYYGVYNVGYYRSDPANPGKLRIKIEITKIVFALIIPLPLENFQRSIIV